MKSGVAIAVPERFTQFPLPPMDENFQGGIFLTSLGLSLTGFLLVTLMSLLLLIFLTPIVLELFRRVKRPSIRDIFTHSPRMKN